MNTLQEQYLDKISAQVFVRANASDVQREIFKQRWLPQNWELSHGKIFEIVDRLLGDVSANTESLKRAGDKLIKVFEEEIIEDSFELKKLIGQDRFPLLYQWLWEYKFPREAWDFMRDIACPVPLPKMVAERELKRPQNNRVRVDEPYRFQFEFGRQGFLYVINHSNLGNKFLLAPSLLFAEIPATAVMANQILQLPLTEDHESLVFGDEGEEFFLVVITENPLELSWVHERVEEEDIDLDGERLGEFFRRVGCDFQPEVFYKKLIVYQ